MLKYIALSLKLIICGLTLHFAVTLLNSHVLAALAHGSPLTSAPILRLARFCGRLGRLCSVTDKYLADMPAA